MYLHFSVLQLLFFKKVDKNSDWGLYPSSKYFFFLQAVLTLTRELRFLENEFHYVKDNQEKEALGHSLRHLGRRLLELVDEFVTKVCTKEWRKENYQIVLLNRKTENNNEETVSATIKVGGKS